MWKSPIMVLKTSIPRADSPGSHRLRAHTTPDQGTRDAAHYHPSFQDAQQTKAAEDLDIANAC